MSDQQPQYDNSQPQSNFTQPQANPGMTVAGGNLNSKNVPLDGNGERDFSFDLFGCLDDPMTCIFAWFLPCTIYGKNKSRLEHLQQGQVHPDGGEILGPDTITYGALTFCCQLGWIIGMQNREAIRQRYHIRGDPATDCLLSWACAPCTLTQQSREIELEEQSLGALGGGMANHGKKQQ